MDAYYEWEPSSREWLVNLPENLRKWCKESFQEAIDYELDIIAMAAKAEVSKFSFEGNLQRSINRITSGVGKRKFFSTGDRSIIAQGVVALYPDKTIVDPEDVVTAPTPFSYGMAKHSPGAKAHVVKLYNPRTGKSTKSRAKLVRQLKAFGGKWAQLPDAPTEDTWKSADANSKDFPPPYVTVDPQKTATDYLTGYAIPAVLDRVVERGWPSLAEKFSA